MAAACGDVDNGGVLRDFVAAFDETGDREFLAIGVAENDASAIGGRNHSVIVVQLFVGEQGFSQISAFGSSGNFDAGTADGEIGIVHGAAAGGARVRFIAEAAATARARDTAQRKNRAVVAVGREFFVVAVSDGACAVHETRADDGADDLHALCIADADAVGEADGERKARGVGGGQAERRPC